MDEKKPKGREILVKGEASARSNAQARPTIARYVPYGEIFEIFQRRGDDLSPSAIKALERYLEKARDLVKGRREDGGIDWRNISNEECTDLFVIDHNYSYNSLFVEMMYRENVSLSKQELQPLMLYRGEDGEIHVTDEGVERQTKTFLEALGRIERDLASPPESIDLKDPSFLIMLTHSLFSQAPIFHPRASDLLMKGKYKKLAIDMTRKQRDIFNPYWDKIDPEKGKTLIPENVPDVLLLSVQRDWIQPLPGESIEDAPQADHSIMESYDGVPFASCDTVREAIRPMWITSLWQMSPETPWTFYEPELRKTKNLIYLIGRKDGGEVKAVPGEEALEILKTLGIETGKLHIQFAAHILDPEKRPMSSYVKTDAASLIKFLSLTEKKTQDKETGKWRRLSRPEQLQELNGYLKALRSIHVLFEAEGKDGRKWTIKDPVPLWDILVFDTNQQFLEDADGSSLLVNTGEIVDLDIRVRAGGWAMGEVATGNKDHLLYSYISKRIIDFPSTEDWAIKLAVYTSCFTSYREGTFKVRTLLEQVMDEMEIEQIMSSGEDRRKRYGAATRLENALAAMEKYGWTITRSLGYLKAMGSSGGRRPNNFFPDLLESTLALTPPPVSGQTLPKEKKPLEAGSSFSGRTFREQRERMGFSQAEAGRELGLSQKLISMIEHGERNLSAEKKKEWDKVRRKYGAASRKTSDKKRGMRP